jgi:hypothetical protein
MDNNRDEIRKRNLGKNMTINIKIVGTEALNNTVLVKITSDRSLKPIDEYSAYVFPSDYKGAKDAQGFLEAIKETCRDLVFIQDQAELKTPLVTDDWVNQEISYETAGVDLTLYDFENGKKEVFAQYPAANKDSIHKLLTTDYPNMHLDPLIRFEDAVTVGVYVNGYGGANALERARGLLSVRKAAQDCVALGVPMFGGTVPRGDGLPERQRDMEGTLTREEFEDFLRKATPYNEFISMAGAGYVFQPWVLDLAKNRKKTIINSQRNTEIVSGVEHAGHIWDTDEASRFNIVSWLSTEGATTSWRTKANEMVMVNLVDLMQAITDKTTTAFEKSWERKEALDLASSFEDVEAA